jgi:hypothetical protein
MAEPTATAGPGARVVAAALAALGLLAVVGLASRGGLGGGGGHGAQPSATLLDYGFTVFLVLYLLAIPVVLWAYLFRERERRAGGGKRGSGLLANLLVVVALVALALLVLAVRHTRGDRLGEKVVPVLPQKPTRKPLRGSDREPRFQWPVLVVFAGLGAAGVAAYVARRRSRGALTERPGLAAELSAALDDALDGVRSETDPRRAVIKAYARMEAILAAYGLPRLLHETPYEYLARALETVAASAGSAGRLTDLYERARFSDHEIDRTMREDAIVALTAIRDELRAATA